MPIWEYVKGPNWMLLAATSLTIFCTGCQANSIDAEIEKLNRLQKQVDAAIIGGHTERYLALLTDDAVLLPPNGAPVSGKKAIRAWNEAMAKQFRFVSYAPTDDEVVVAGDWAFRRARFHWTIAPIACGEPVRDS
jgi:ketosteroid isomerase-like protein